jgi:hypothetical protein
MKRTHLFLLAASAALVLVGTVWAQPERRQDRVPDQGRGAGQPVQPEAAAQDRPPREAPPVDRDKLKEELTRRLEETKRTQARLEQALARLNDGGDPADIRRETMPGRFRDRLRRAARDDAPGLDRPLDPQENRARGEPGPLPRGPQGPKGAGPMNDRKLTPDDRDRMLKFLDEHMPRIGKRFHEALKDNPQIAEGLLGRLAPKFRELEATQHSQPELFKLRVDDMRAAITLQEAARMWRPKLRGKDATDDDRRAAREALTVAISEQFDARLALREHELKMLEDRIGEARREIDEMHTNRDKRIDDEVDRWLGDLIARESNQGDR